MIETVILILIIAFSVFLAAVFAGSETGVYQLSRIRLRIGVEKKQFSFIILAKIMRDSPALLVSILIGTSLTHYVTTSVITFMFLSRLQNEHYAELFATLLAAPLLFVFSELITKNIFCYRADKLMPYTAPVLYTFKKLRETEFYHRLRNNTLVPLTAEVVPNHLAVIVNRHNTPTM